MAAWQTLTCSVFFSLFLAGITLAVHEVPEGPWLVNWLHVCSALVIDRSAVHGGSLLPLLGLGLTLFLLGSLACAAIRIQRSRRRDTARQLELLDLVCTPHSDPDVVVLPHSTPTAYCLPGPRQRVVVTDGAMAALTEAQMRQVLAHERAHLKAHHHLALGCAEAFERVLRGRLGSGVAKFKIAELAEMHADDAADRSHRMDLATAMLVLAGGSKPLGALGAGGSATTRIKRLISPSAPIERRTRTAVTGLIGFTALFPAVIAMAPGMARSVLEHCPFLL
jgi:beta-lactamase regulating signal transducer with metallopeptidase domain